VFNLTGIPGIVRECNYSASVSNARIEVMARDMFTVISVNGLDIYFHRLTGKIDGIGLNGCTSETTQRSAELPEQFELLNHKARNRTL
jgi:hypothetical protein